MQPFEEPPRLLTNSFDLAKGAICVEPICQSMVMEKEGFKKDVGIEHRPPR